MWPMLVRVYGIYHVAYVSTVYRIYDVAYVSTVVQYIRCGICY